MVFRGRLSDSKSSQVSRTLLSILAVFNNAVVWMVSTRPPTAKSSRPFNNPLVTVPKAPITIGMIVTFIFYSFFSYLARSRYLSLFSIIKLRTAAFIFEAILTKLLYSSHFFMHVVISNLLVIPGPGWMAEKREKRSRCLINQRDMDGRLRTVNLGNSNKRLCSVWLLCFKCISTPEGYLMLKPSLYKYNWGTF